MIFLLFFFLVSSFTYFIVGFSLLCGSRFTIKIISWITRKLFESITPKEKRTKDQHKKFLKFVGYFCLGIGLFAVVMAVIVSNMIL